MILCQYERSTKDRAGCATFGFFVECLATLVSSWCTEFWGPLDCSIVDQVSGACLKYSGGFTQVLYTTFVATGAEHLYLIIGLGVVLVIIGTIMSFFALPARRSPLS